MTDERLQAIKERTEKATLGPWEWYKDSEDEELEPILKSGGKDVMDFGHSAQYYPSSGTPPKVEDAQFIAHAREDIPALIAELEWYKKAQEAWWKREKLLQKEIIRLQDMEVNEYYRLRIGLETIAHHNIHTTTQTEIKDYAREVLQIKPRNAEEEALINKIMANLKLLDGESNE